MFYFLTRYALYFYLNIMFGIKIKGIKNIPKKGGVVICSNHVSNFDPCVLTAIVPRTIHFFAKKELFSNPWKKFWLNQLKAFPADRDVTDMKALKFSIKLLKNGGVLGIFVQGTRVKEGQQVSGKGGAALFALKGNAVIVPVGIKADYKKKRNPIYVNIGKPISYEANGKGAIKSEQIEEITNDVMKKIDVLVKEN